jgi:hypothetical protein
LKRFPDFGLVEIPKEHSSYKRSENVPRKKENMRGDIAIDKNRGSERGSDVNRTLILGTEQEQVEGKIEGKEGGKEGLKVEREVKGKVERRVIEKGEGKRKVERKSAARKALNQEQGEATKIDGHSHSRPTHTLGEDEGEGEKRRLKGSLEEGEEVRERGMEGDGGGERRHLRLTSADSTTRTYSEPDVGHSAGHNAVHHATTGTSTNIHTETGTGIETWTQTWTGTGTVTETQTQTQTQTASQTASSQTEKQPVTGTVAGMHTTEGTGSWDHRFQSRASEVYTFDKTPDYMRSEVVMCMCACVCLNVCVCVLGGGGVVHVRVRVCVNELV